MDEKKRQTIKQIEIPINIALIGEVSSGKTTLLNSMYIKTLSDMKRIRTTMSVNNYSETQDPRMIDDPTKIYTTNTEYEVDMKGKQMTELKEFKYNVYPSISFGTSLMKSTNKYKLNVIDIPGLNDGSANDIIKKWINDNFHNFDVVFFVINGEYALNTESERKLLSYIVENIEKNPHVILFNIINKYDDPSDEELNELKEQAETIINSLKDKKINSVTIPMSAERAYIYRYIEINKSMDGLSQKHRNLISVMELGTKSKKYDDKKLLTELIKSIEDSKNDTNSCYNSTNYRKLIDEFKKRVIDKCDNIYYNKTISHIKRSNMNIDQIIDSYNKIIDVAPKTKDPYLESKICQMYDDVKNKDNIAKMNKIITNNSKTITYFCDYGKITKKIYDTYHQWCDNIRKSNSSYSNEIYEWLLSVSCSPVHSYGMVSNLLIDLYENSKYYVVLDNNGDSSKTEENINDVKELCKARDKLKQYDELKWSKKNHDLNDQKEKLKKQILELQKRILFGNQKQDRHNHYKFLFEDYLKQFKIIESTSMAKKYEILNAYMIFVIDSIIMCKNQMKEIDLIKLILSELNTKKYNNMYISEMLPYFYLRMKTIINTPYDNLDIPTDIKCVDKYIDSIDPGFKYMFDTISKIKLNNKSENKTNDEFETNEDDEEYENENEDGEDYEDDD